MNPSIKRLFFGWEVIAPWPEGLPKGRLLDEPYRHMTIAFLGNVDYKLVEKTLTKLPLPARHVGIAGIFKAPLFLPHQSPRCVSWHVEPLASTKWLLHYQKELSNHLFQHHLLGKNEYKRNFLPHVTLCRKPFSKKEWKKSFTPLPMITKNLHLYESIGNLKYPPIWTHNMHPPFEEINHPAGLAFHIYGEGVEEIYTHAFIALAFHYPFLVNYYHPPKHLNSLEEVMIALNAIIAEVDVKVNFHGTLNPVKEKVSMCQMIVEAARN